MPVKRRKDKTDLVVSGTFLAVHVYERRAADLMDETRAGRAYWHVYLWRTFEAMAAASVEEIGEGCRAFVCHETHWFSVDDRFERDDHQDAYLHGDDRIKSGMHDRKLGEAHFLSGHWDAMLVWHEVMHMVTGTSKCIMPGLQTAILTGDIRVEELWAYRAQRYSVSIYNFLVEEDPAFKDDPAS